MTDTYSALVNNPVGGFVAKNLGLPKPVPLDRYVEGAPLIDGAVLVGSAPGGRLGPSVATILAGADAHVDSRLDDEVRSPLGAAGVDAGVWNPGGAGVPALEGARLRRHRDHEQRAASRALVVLPPDDPQARAERAADRL